MIGCGVCGSRAPRTYDRSGGRFRATGTVARLGSPRARRRTGSESLADVGPTTLPVLYSPRADSTSAQLRARVEDLLLHNLIPSLSTRYPHPKMTHSMTVSHCRSGIYVLRALSRSATTRSLRRSCSEPIVPTRSRCGTSEGRFGDQTTERERKATMCDGTTWQRCRGLGFLAAPAERSLAPAEDLRSSEAPGDAAARDPGRGSGTDRPHADGSKHGLLSPAKESPRSWRVTVGGFFRLGAIRPRVRSR